MLQSRPISNHSYNTLLIDLDALKNSLTSLYEWWESDKFAMDMEKSGITDAKFWLMDQKMKSVTKKMEKTYVDGIFAVQKLLRELEKKVSNKNIMRHERAISDHKRLRQIIEEWQKSDRPTRQRLTEFQSQFMKLLDEAGCIMREIESRSHDAAMAYYLQFHKDLQGVITTIAKQYLQLLDSFPHARPLVRAQAQSSVIELISPNVRKQHRL